jgi:hypothetical protein
MGLATIINNPRAITIKNAQEFPERLILIGNGQTG